MVANQLSICVNEIFKFGFLYLLFFQSLNQIAESQRHPKLSYGVLGPCHFVNIEWSKEILKLMTSQGKNKMENIPLGNITVTVQFVNILSKLVASI